MVLTADLRCEGVCIGMINSLAGALLLVCAWAAGLRAAEDENLIVPGEKIGQIALSSSPSTVNKLLGLPTTSTDGRGPRGDDSTQPLPGSGQVVGEVPGGCRAPSGRTTGTRGSES